MRPATEKNLGHLAPYESSFWISRFVPWCYLAFPLGKSGSFTRLTAMAANLGQFPREFCWIYRHCLANEFQRASKGGANHRLQWGISHLQYPHVSPHHLFLLVLRQLDNHRTWFDSEKTICLSTFIGSKMVVSPSFSCAKFPFNSGTSPTIQASSY